MKAINWLAATLLVVGGLNWGLVAVAELDLVATLVGLDFGETNAVSRLIYALVGLSAVYVIAALLAGRERFLAGPSASAH